MEITINDAKTLQEIQQEFNQYFPNLKIEFFKKEHELKEGNQAKDVVDLQKKIGEVRKVHHSGGLSINGHKKVVSLEKEFEEKYGLNAQVFRRSGRVWLQTTATDEWTLAEQNQAGHE